MSLVLRFVLSDKLQGQEFWIKDVEAVATDFKSMVTVRDGKAVITTSVEGIDKEALYVFLDEVTDLQEHRFHEFLKAHLNQQWTWSASALIAQGLLICEYFPFDLPLLTKDITVRDLYLMIAVKHRVPLNPNIEARHIPNIIRRRA